MLRNVVLILFYVACVQIYAELSTTQVQYSPRSFWNQVLWHGTNRTGLVSRDALAERLLQQLFKENIKISLKKREKILGTVLDPVWLWPQEPVELKRGSLIRGTMEACNLHLHNLKTIQLLDIEVQRNAEMTLYAVRINLRVPILWMTGHYTLTRSMLFGFIPTGGEGDFNIDVKNVKIGVIATLHANKNSSVSLKAFEVGVTWKDVAFKVDGLKKGFNHMTDWTLNQLGVGAIIAEKQRDQIVTEIELYSRGLFECFLYNPAEQLNLCMRRFWISRGFVWPWTTPSCT